MIEIDVGDLNCKVRGSPKTVSKLRRIFNFENDFRVRQQSNFKVPKYTYFVSEKGMFKTGLLTSVLKYFKSKGINYKLYDHRTIQTPPESDDVELYLEYLPYKLRPYQVDCVFKGLEEQNGVFHLATGGGKTIVMAGLLLAWYKKSIVLVDKIDLAKQLQEELSFLMEEEVGLIGAGIWNPKRVTVCIVQTLTTKRSSKKKKIRNFLKEVEHLCFDECHHIQSTTWRKAARMCSNASIRHGFTATPMTTEHKDSKGKKIDQNLYIYSYIGPILSEIPASKLIEWGYLAKPYVKFIKNEVYFDGEPFQYSEEYERIIIDDEHRNHLVCKVISDYYQKDKQVVGFVHRLKHGRVIAKMLVNEYGVDPDDIAFVNGESVSSLRRENIKEFKQGGLPILLGTVLNEGLNFFCDAGINISGGASEKNALQRLGRILRKKSRNEDGDVDTSVLEEVDYIEFADNGHPFFEDHAETRLETYFFEGHEISFLDPEEV